MRIQLRDLQQGIAIQPGQLKGRDFKNVHRDVSVLVSVGLFELVKGKGQRGDAQKPTSPADALMLKVA